MALKLVYALRITAPQSVADAVFARLPDDALGSSAFKYQNDDHSVDPLWVCEGYYAAIPDTAALTVDLVVLATVHGHVPYAMGIEALPAQGWLKDLAQACAPIRAGRIMIHGAQAKDNIHPPTIGIEMEASCAFGTGEHPTTYGCLIALQNIKTMKRGARGADIGSGSGVLAMAMAKLWHARIVAGECDADSVMVAKDNRHKNGVRRNITMIKALGFNHAVFRAGRSFDVIASNIFMRPLMQLAPAMRRHLAKGGRIVLAGFLKNQENRVFSAFAAQGFARERRYHFGVWSILVLKKKS